MDLAWLVAAKHDPCPAALATYSRPTSMVAQGLVTSGGESILRILDPFFARCNRNGCGPGDKGAGAARNGHLYHLVCGFSDVDSDCSEERLVSSQ